MLSTKDPARPGPVRRCTRLRLRKPGSRSFDSLGQNSGLASRDCVLSLLATVRAPPVPNLGQLHLPSPPVHLAVLASPGFAVRRGEPTPWRSTCRRQTLAKDLTLRGFDSLGQKSSGTMVVNSTTDLVEVFRDDSRDADCRRACRFTPRIAPGVVEGGP